MHYQIKACKVRGLANLNIMGDVGVDKTLPLQPPPPPPTLPTPTQPILSLASRSSPIHVPQPTLSLASRSSPIHVPQTTYSTLHSTTNFSPIAFSPQDYFSNPSVLSPIPTRLASYRPSTPLTDSEIQTIRNSYQHSPITSSMLSISQSPSIIPSPRSSFQSYNPLSPHTGMSTPNFTNDSQSFFTLSRPTSPIMFG